MLHPPAGYHLAPHSRKGAWTDGRGHYWYPGDEAPRHALAHEDPDAAHAEADRLLAVGDRRSADLTRRWAVYRAEGEVPPPGKAHLVPHRAKDANGTSTLRWVHPDTRADMRRDGQESWEAAAPAPKVERGAGVLPAGERHAPASDKAPKTERGRRIVADMPEDQRTFEYPFSGVPKAAVLPRNFQVTDEGFERAGEVAIWLRGQDGRWNRYRNEETGEEWKASPQGVVAPTSFDDKSGRLWRMMYDDLTAKGYDVVFVKGDAVPPNAQGSLVEESIFRTSEDRPPNWLGLDPAALNLSVQGTSRGNLLRHEETDPWLKASGFYDACKAARSGAGGWEEATQASLYMSIGKGRAFEDLSDAMKGHYLRHVAALTTWWQDLNDGQREHFWKNYVDETRQYPVGTVTDPLHEDESYTAPRGLNIPFKLHSFQRKGLNFLLKAKRVLLAFEMGLGKTIIGVSAFHTLKEQGHVDRMVVTAPRSAHSSWRQHFADYSDQRVVVFDGTAQAQRGLAAWRRGEADVLVCTPEAMVERESTPKPPKSGKPTGDFFVHTRTGEHSETLPEGADLSAYRVVPRDALYVRGEHRVTYRDGAWRDQHGRAADAPVADAPYIPSTNAARQLAESMDSRVFRVLDEAHTYKNPTAARSKGALDLLSKGAEYLLGLSGTPKPNRVEDFHHVVKVITPGVFPDSFKDFAKRYCYVTHGGNKTYGFRSEKLGDLYRDSSRGVMARTTRDPDAKIELPARIDLAPRLDLDAFQTEIGDLLPHYTDLRKMAMYDGEDRGRMLQAEAAGEQLAAAQRGELGPGHRVAARGAPASHRALLGKFQMLAIHPALLDPEWGDENPTYESPKIRFIADAAVEHMTQQPETAGVLFCDFRKAPKVMRRALERRGVDPAVIGEYRSELNDQQRNDVQNKLRSGEYKYVLGSSGALETGANMQHRANFVAHLNTPWKPDRLVQTTARVYRQGQRNKVTVLRPIGSDVEDIIDRVVNRKITQSTQATGRQNQADAEITSTMRGEGKRVSLEEVARKLGISPASFVEGPDEPDDE